MEIPITQPKSIYDYGFDKSLNRENAKENLPDNIIEEKVRNVLLQSNISIDTVNKNSSGNFERNDLHWFTVFESIDGFLTTRTTVTDTYVQLLTGNLLGENASLEKSIQYFFSKLTWNKNRKFRTKINLLSATNQQSYILAGETGNSKHIGFYIDPATNKLYGTVANGTAETQLLLQSLGIDSYSLEVKYFARERVDFYVDDVFRGTITTNLPFGGGLATDYSDKVIKVTLSNFANEVKTMRISFWDFWQAV